MCMVCIEHSCTCVATLPNTGPLEVVDKGCKRLHLPIAISFNKITSPR